MHPTNQHNAYFAEIVRTCKSTNSAERVLSLIVDRIVRSYHCNTCAVVLIDPTTEYLKIDNCHNLSLTFCNAFRRRIATNAIGKLLWTGKPILIRDSTADQTLATEVQLETPFASCLIVQIAIDQRTLGYLHCDSANRGAFDAADIESVQLFADIAGLAIVKARLYEENMRLDRIDHETDLEKYVSFLERMKAATERAREFSESFTILLLDIDNFKDTVNTYGYDSSRQLLKEMGHEVQRSLRPIDAAGRYGFDEFVVMLANAGLESGLEIAQRLRQHLASRQYTARTISSTVSIGVATFPRHGTTVEAVLVTAKQALFEAQRTGRNSVFSFKNDLFTHEHSPVQEHIVIQ